MLPKHLFRPLSLAGEPTPVSTMTSFQPQVDTQWNPSWSNVPAAPALPRAATALYSCQMVGNARKRIMTEGRNVKKGVVIGQECACSGELSPNMTLLESYSSTP